MPRNQTRYFILAFTICTLFSFQPITIAAEDSKLDDQLDVAREHLQKGRTDEALELYLQLFIDHIGSADVVIGMSQAHQTLGEWSKATDVLEKAVKASPENARLLSRLAEVHFLQGRYSEAEKLVQRALAIDSENPLTRIVQADLWTETGQIEKADNGYRWFVRYYNRAQPKDAESLLLVARGALQYARWHGSSQIFNFALNTLCPDALKNDSTSWQSYLISGSLLLEKYNRAEAIPELKQALTINPQAAEVLVALGNAALQHHDLEKAGQLADQALKLNPGLTAAFHLKADVILSDGTTQKTLETLSKALKINPLDQRTHARVAACYLLADGLPEEERLNDLLSNLDAIKNVTIEKPTRFEKLTIELAKRNPKPGYFLTILGQTLEAQRKFAIAERFFQQAITLMPQLSEPKTSLGMLYMRVGKTKEAQKLLDDAFKADPYHVRVSNMRKVLKVLDGYEIISTPHFVIRVDSQADKILGHYMAEYLEEQYEPLVKHFGFEPPNRTQFEIYNNAKGLTAHQWFSARMIGLPWIQTIGASTGVIVALASPTASEQSFNWARVLKHEFVHIITLQQTKFNIPHWFTEALAVTAEETVRPAIWNQMLLERVPAGNLRSLDELNQGFQRPDSAADWQFAYCQSRLYAQYMIETYGEKTISKMLEAYRNNVATNKAIPQVFGVDVETFEKGYRKFLDNLVTQLKGGEPDSQESLADLEKAYLVDTKNSKQAAKYAYRLLLAQRRKQARELALKALEINKAEPLAAVVLAKLELLSQDVDAAAGYLTAALNREKPNKLVLEMLATIRVSQEKYTEAEELYTLGRKHFPDDVSWVKGLAAVAIRAGKTTGLRDILESLARMDADNAVVRKKLAQMALDRNDYAEAVIQGKESLYVNVLDVETHRMLGKAYTGLNNHKKAVIEYEVAIKLEPNDSNLKLSLARAYRDSGDKKKARTELEKLLSDDSNNAEAKKLLESL